MSNIYWPVYKNLERGVLDLSYSIHIDDTQLSVYSSQISDLILRASAEIESISKELYKQNGGVKTERIKYDTDALVHLNNLWKLESKVVLISSANCFQTNKELKPFIQAETSTIHGRLTYSWNNSYQNLKHDRANSLNFGSVKYLFDIMSALFILNLYYKSEIILLYDDTNGLNFPINLGSDLFSIKLHKWVGHDETLNFKKSDDFDECLYYVHYTESTFEEVKAESEKINEKARKLLEEHPKYIEYIATNDPAEYQGNNFIYDILGADEHIKLVIEANRKYTEIFRKANYEAVINKQDL
ncbi:hypothetical protein KB553_12550 [Chryseobacterium rhizoplanae]|uniref:hypothetical protein n=1 Tax=Chryseobacterium rhizoplanae TaxID=1609531 RepID=UPI001CE359BF|nr:hypothetical protein [Chryseobacterium rhizoplanae]UCA57884.1 hypothetical protein KB553_12550 [Chryseobacterium rhizoplanae]